MSKPVRPKLAPPIRPRCGVRIAGTGSCIPDQRLTNADLEKVMDTTDEWIVQRTGVRERRIVDKAKGESTTTLAAEALRRALTDANMAATDLDFLIVATVTPEMTCPSVSCRVTELVSAGRCGAMDLSAACSGFVYGVNLAHELIRGGAYSTVGVIGCDVLSSIMDYSTAGRGTAILFGDAGAGAILKATDDTSKGILAQAMHSDGRGWKDLYVPYEQADFPPGHEFSPSKLGIMQMNGRAVFKFAVGTFGDLIAETLTKAGLTADDVDHFICHQSNARILEAARERFGLPPEKLYVNIDRIGNTSGGSVPLCLDELRREGRVKEGQVVMFVAFGAGLTWASSLWQL
jgi:3-oxoacyl-[acyl-carrier-protein] synthase III